MLKDGIHATAMGRERVDALAIHPDFSGGWPLETRDKTKQSCFA
jgi:hypothetical protein